MAKHTIKGFIVYETWSGDKEGKFRFQDHQPITNGTGYSQVPVCEHTLEFETPEGFDPRPAQQAALLAKKLKERAEYVASLERLDAELNNLRELEAA